MVETDTPDDNDPDLIKFCSSRPSPTKWTHPPCIQRLSALNTKHSAAPPAPETTVPQSKTVDMDSIQEVIEKVVTELIAPLKSLIHPPSTDVQAQLNQCMEQLEKSQTLIQTQTALIEDQQARLTECATKLSNTTTSLNELQEKFASTSSQLSDLRKSHSTTVTKYEIRIHDLQESLKGTCKQQLFLNWCIAKNLSPDHEDNYQAYLDSTDGGELPQHMLKYIYEGLNSPKRYKSNTDMQSKQASQMEP